MLDINIFRKIRNLQKGIGKSYDELRGLKRSLGIADNAAGARSILRRSQKYSNRKKDRVPL